MFFRQSLIETRKTLAHPALWLGLAGLSILMAGFMLIQHAQMAYSSQPVSGGLEQDLIGSLTFFGWIGSLVYAVTASVIAAYDYPDRSIQVWLIRGLPRPTLIAARLAVVLLFGLILVGYAVFASLAFATLSRLVFFGQIDAAQMNWAALLPTTLRLFWSAVPYLMLTVLLGITSRSPLFAAGGTVIYATVIERVLGSLSTRFPALVQNLPAALGSVLQESLVTLNLTALPADPAPELRAALTIGILSLALAGAALLIFSRQDLGG